MGGARALIASLGASISLVAAAAVSLLFFSVVFALPGITGGADAPAASTAVVVASQPVRAVRARWPVREASAPVIISPTRPARAAARRSGPRASVKRGRRDDKPSFDAKVRDLGKPPPPAAVPTPAPAQAPAIGDGVRDVGDAVSATVQSTAGAGATAPLLGPPVRQVVQDVLDLLASVVQGATGALAGALDKTVPR